MRLNDHNLKSRYIPVASLGAKTPGLNFWDKKNAFFHYPNLLVNLAQIKGHKTELGIDDDSFLLCDSGGFQVITGKCEFDWKTSLEKQLEIGATKIFSFDIPPITKKSKGSNAFFDEMPFDKTKELIEVNIDTAIKQSNYLKTLAPDKIKDFFCIIHGSNKELLDYNIELLDKKIGLENFSKYFGGACYAAKAEDRIFFTTTLLHAREHFIKKGLPIHVLGAGAPYKMILLVRCEMTTFDSGTALSGVTYWAWLNQINMLKGGGFVGQLNKDNWPFIKEFCDCPICQNTDYNKMIKDELLSKEIGNHIMVHNLYQLIKLNIFLDGIDKKHYTRIVEEYIGAPNDVVRCLEYIDLADKEGFKIAYDKYKHFIKKDKSKQQSLF